MVSIEGGRAWIKVWVDGKIDADDRRRGKVFGDGKTLTFTRQGIDRGPDRIVGRDERSP